MDTHKIIIAIVILTLFGLVLYFCNKTKPLEGFYQALQPWTGDQLTRSFDLFRSILPTEDDNMLECLISELSRKMSFKDFLLQNNKQRLQSILDIKENCMKPQPQPQPHLQPQLQHWTDDQLTRSFDLFRSILPKEDDNILECLISELSRKMSFKDFLAQNNKDRLESILYIKENCKLQPWTGDQLVRSFDLFRSILPTEDDNMLECVISELSRKMSFKDFLAQNNIQRFQSILGLKENCMKHCMKKTGDQLNLYFDLV